MLQRPAPRLDVIWIEGRPSCQLALYLLRAFFFLSQLCSFYCILQVGRVTVGGEREKKTTPLKRPPPGNARRRRQREKDAPGIHSWRDSALPATLEENFFTLARLISTGFIVLTGACYEEPAGPIHGSKTQPSRRERRQARAPLSSPIEQLSREKPSVAHRVGLRNSFQEKLGECEKRLQSSIDQVDVHCSMRDCARSGCVTAICPGSRDKADCITSRQRGAR